MYDGEKKYAEIVILEYNLNKTFHYCISQDLRDQISIGTRVLIPFRGKVTIGCVVGFLQESAIKNLRNISQIVDKKPLLTPDIVKLTQWISNYYICSWGKTLNYVIPQTRKKWLTDSEKTETPPLKPRLSKDYNFSYNKNILLKEDKKSLLKNIEKFVKNKKSRALLLRSDDFTERVKIYFRCIQAVLERKKQVIILAPTESHLSELARWLEKEFKGKVVVFDENIDQKTKYLQWIKIRNSEVDIALGMRSTIFVPFDRLGLIIIEREHSSLYKEERMPRYNAREVALKRAELENIPLILSSETPSIESYWNVFKNNFKEIDFIKTGGKKESLLKNRIIDMTEEKSQKKIISYELQQAILRSLKREKQIVLFLNKRGFSSFVICNQCGNIPKCVDCNTSLSYHLNIQKKAQLVCHNCGKKTEVMDICGKCGSKDIRLLGMGTQKLEGEINKMFPRAKIKRLDRDSLIKNNDYKQILEDFKRGDINILIGTQMVIKGVDFNVDLVGIISADTLLNLPDYRSGEKTFQLLSEVISSFRETNFPKEVIIQTFNPDHHCIIALREQDYNYFYQKEIELRKELGYPPFTHIIRMEIRGEERETVKQRAEYLIDYLNSIQQVKEAPEFKLLGAENMILWKSKNNFKVQFIIKVKDLEKFSQAFKDRYDKMLLNYFDKENRLTIDVDPVKML